MWGSLGPLRVWCWWSGVGQMRNGVRRAKPGGPEEHIWGFQKLTGNLVVVKGGRRTRSNGKGGVLEELVWGRSHEACRLSLVKKGRGPVPWSWSTHQLDFCKVGPSSLTISPKQWSLGLSMAIVSLGVSPILGLTNRKFQSLLAWNYNMALRNFLLQVWGVHHLKPRRLHYGKILAPTGTFELKTSKPLSQPGQGHTEPQTPQGVLTKQLVTIIYYWIISTGVLPSWSLSAQGKTKTS